MSEFHQQIERCLLTPIWRGIPADYKRKYLNIWEQFENNIKSAAYTDKLPKFLSRITQRLGVAIHDADTVVMTTFLKSASARETLHALRNDTALLVLMVRVQNEKRKETFLELQKGKPLDRDFREATQQANDTQQSLFGE
jgi:hypothetical protein